MNLNKSTLYALDAALDLAVAGGRPMTAAQIARRHDIPENVVAKVLQQLARSGLAHASRGVGGGYRLVCAAAETTVQDVIDLFEPSPSRTGLEERHWPCASTPQDRLRDLFLELDETARATLASVSLSTLAGLPSRSVTSSPPTS